MVWEEHLDKNGMIVQKLGDDCDQAQREGMFSVGQKNTINPILIPKKSLPEVSLKLLESDVPGDYKRTGNDDSRCARNDMLTRDQATGIIALMSVVKDNKRLKKFFINMLKRGFFTNNKTKHADAGANPENYGKSKRDFLGFDQIASCIRMLNWYWMWPLVWIGDLSLLYSTLNIRFWNKDDDVLNYVVRLVMARLMFNTVIGSICAKIADPDDLYGRLVVYFTRTNDSGDHGPPMYEVYNLDFLRKVCK